MNKRKILRATRALHRLENTQDSFNEAVNDLTDEELAEWAKQNNVTFEDSETKQRIRRVVDEVNGGKKE